MQCIESIAARIARAENGCITAQYNLACDYYNGNAVEVDYIEAARWMRKAAGQGDDHAQHTLGFMYQHGIGVRKNYLLSVWWCGRAAYTGLHKKAGKEADE